MADQPKCTLSTEFVALELQAAAHFLRGLGSHLTALALSLPRPPDHVQTLILESSQDDAFEAYPEFELATWVEAVAGSEVQEAAEALSKVADKYLGAS